MRSGQPTSCPKQHTSQQKEYAKQGDLKNTPIARAVPFNEEQDSNTRQFTYVPSKFKNKDEQQTNKEPWKIQKKLPGTNLSKNTTVNKAQRLSFLGKLQDTKHLSLDPRVDEVLSKPPLRQRFNQLLPSHQRLPIGIEHLHLIQKMKIVNRTLDFFRKTRSTKRVTFKELNANIGSSIQATVSIQHIQQLLFLKQDMYQVSWELGKRSKSQIMIGLSNNFDQSSQNQKVQCVRKTIFELLSAKEKQFICSQSEKGIEVKRQNCSSWVRGFQYQGVKIPLKSLPPNPDNKGAMIQTMDNSQIRKIKHNDISKLFSRMKQQSDVKSFSSADAMDMIFSKTPVSRLKQQLSASVKEKQRKRQLQIQKDKDKPDIDAETLIKVSEQLMFCYNSKNLSNMFTVTVQKILYDRLKLTEKAIRDSLKILMQAEKIKFISQLTTHDGKKVLNLVKKNYKQIRAYIQESFKGEQQSKQL